MSTKKLIFILIVSVFLLYFKINNVFGFNVSPGRADFTVKAGQECIKEFFITNTEDSPIRIKATLKDLLRIMPEAEKFKEEERATLKEDYLLSQFSKVYPDKLYIAPKEVGKLSLKISMPGDAKGEYYGSIFFENLPPESKAGGIGIVSRIGMALYVAIEGTEIFKCEIGKFEILSTKPLKFNLIVRNLGNVHLRPEGNIIFKIREDTKEFQVPINIIHAPILPNMELDLGSKKTEAKLMPGEYTVSINLEYRKGNVLNKKLEFVIFEDGEVSPITER